ncbi:MAG: condensation domain-containing protein, partial [Pseudomonadales bacterium]|nr:condensation domain-containing protein [Pseudomonadales bacterium]
MPLTASGKVDRKALPEVEASSLRATYVAPRTEEEQRVAEAFARVLDLDVKTISIHDNFFDLGGHSLLAMRLVTQLEVATGRMLAVRAVFECPTVLELSQALVEATTGVLESIDRVDRSQRLPLAFQQERLWFLDRLDESAGRAYHIEGAVRLRGELDIDALGRALVEVVNRHEALRTHFELGEDGDPVQVIDEPNGFTLAVEEVAGLDEPGVSGRVGTLLTKRFDLERGPLFRATLLVRSEEEYVLVIGGHHTVLDGWSVNLLLSEIGELYESRINGKPLDLPRERYDLPGERAELPGVGYADYAVWQRKEFAEARMGEAIGWWQEELEGIAE